MRMNSSRAEKKAIEICALSLPQNKVFGPGRLVFSVLWIKRERGSFVHKKQKEKK
jgi:hypothetical protein